MWNQLCRQGISLNKLNTTNEGTGFRTVVRGLGSQLFSQFYFPMAAVPSPGGSGGWLLCVVGVVELPALAYILSLQSKRPSILTGLWGLN